jgi:nicotinamidase-related amidase
VSRPLELDPATTAVVTMELQRGVVGDLATHPDLVAAMSPRLAAVAAVCSAARAAGARVVHATVSFRSDVTFTTNSPIQRASARANASVLAEGSPGVEVVADIGPSPDDVVAVRHTGMTPFNGTDLHERLQQLGVDTVVATGVSVNVGILGLVISGADLGYRVVVPRDAVAGLPASYADAVLDGTISLLATVTTTDDVVAALGGPAARG